MLEGSRLEKKLMNYKLQIFLKQQKDKKMLLSNWHDFKLIITLKKEI